MEDVDFEFFTLDGASMKFIYVVCKRKQAESCFLITAEYQLNCTHCSIIRRKGDSSQDRQENGGRAGVLGEDEDLP